MSRYQVFAVGVAAVLCIGGIAWMFTGRSPEWLVGNASVVGGVVGLVGLGLGVATALSGRKSPSAPASAADGRLPAALEYLADETLRYWRNEAKVRKITTPVPAAVRWRWADARVAAPPGDLRPAVGGPQPLAIESGRSSDRTASVLTSGIVTRLRTELYQAAQAPSRIIVLGGAGAGKTTAMILLLIDILENRTAAAPASTPVLLTLSNWNPARSLQKWMAQEIVEDYPGLGAHGGRRTVERLLRGERLALFLDGLDELPRELQGQALAEIDRAGAGLRVVLSSRNEEYEAAVRKGRLWGAAVINLLPVGAEQARHFLLAEQIGERRRVWESVASFLARHPTSVAARTLRSPLALSLARDAYRTGDPRELLDSRRHPTPDRLLRHLLRQILVIAYPDVDRRRHATRWLSWIAARMGGNDLRWSDIPGWVLPRRTRWLSGRRERIWLRLAAGGVGAALIACLLPTDLPPALLVFVAFVSLIVGGVAVACLPVPDPYRMARLTPRRINRRDFFDMTAAGALNGAASGFLAGSVSKLTLAHGFGYGLLVGFGVGFLYGIAIRLVSCWLEPGPMAGIVGFRESYRADRTRAVVSGLVCATILALFAGALCVLLSDAAGVLFAVPVFVAAFLAMSGGPSQRLAVAEMLLAFRGRRVRFMRLLTESHEKQVLRQAGPVYQFRHALLQDLLRRE